jgi:hypothetical protein
MDFDTVTATFKSRYTLSKAVTGATVVYLNDEYWYPNGFDYTVEINDEAAPSGSYTADTTDPTRLSIMFPADTTYDGKQISINVTAKLADITSIL